MQLSKLPQGCSRSYVSRIRYSPTGYSNKNNVQLEIRISKGRVPSFKKAKAVIFIGAHNTTSLLSV